jgi:hypothetical protein
MTNIPQDVIDDAKKAGFNTDGKHIWLNGEYGYLDLPENLLKFAALRDARQSSQSEPVAISVPTAPIKIWLCIGDTDFEEVEREGWKWNDLAEVTWSTDRIDQCDIPYIRADLAAPQQAIPSGLIETLKFYANKANYKTSWDSDSNHVMEDKGEIARNALAAYESAAPTAPIESNK